MRRSVEKRAQRAYLWKAVTGCRLIRNYSDSLSIKTQGTTGSGEGSLGLRNRKNRLRRPLPVFLHLLCSKQNMKKKPYIMTSLRLTDDTGEG